MSDYSHDHHAHDHSHDDHHHDDGDTYFINQLCMVGLSGAFGAICLCLWFWQKGMLSLLLGEQFHPFVLASGFTLVLLSGTRAVILWRQSRDPAFRHAHDHSHDYAAHEHSIQAKAPLLQSFQPVPAHVHTADCGHDHHHDELGVHDHDHHIHPHEHTIGHAHVGADHDESDHDHGWAPWRYVVIMVPIIIFLLGLPNKPPAIQIRGVGVDYEQLILAFTSIVYEAMPFIVLGVLIAGLLEEFVPQQAITKFIPQNRALAILLGGVLGLVFPMCECGIIVVMKRLLRKGLPLSVCVSYMLAGPVINVVVMTSTFVAFNPPQERDYILGGPYYVVAWRVGLSYIIAFTTALLVDWQWNKHGKRLLHPSVMHGLDRPAFDDETGIAKRSWGESINNITQTALNDYVDIMAFLILGACLAAGGKYVMKQTEIHTLFQQEPTIAILIMMAIAVLFCLCSEADAFVAANFPLYWPPASKIAFLVLGPMLDLKLYLMYTRVFRTRLIFTIMGSVVLQVFIYSRVLAYFDTTPLPTSSEDIMLSPDQETYLTSIGLGPDPLSQLVHFGIAYNPPPSGKGAPVDFKTLEALSATKDLRDSWKERIIEVRGQFKPHPGTRQLFELVRLKIQCCANDAIELNVPMLSREAIEGINPSDWVKVTGKVDFRERNGAYFTVVHVANGRDVVRCDPDPSPYIK